MIKIVQYTQYNNEFFFFAEGNKTGLSKTDVSMLIEKGLTNLSQKQFNNITQQN